MINVDDKIQELKERCAKANMRLTPQRIEVLKMIASVNNHPDAETVYAEVKKGMPSISLDTVYRTLTSLEDLGLVFKVDNELAKTRYDADLTPHCHFICVKCGAVHDVHIDNYIKAPDESYYYGEVLQKNLQVKGICKKCRGQFTQYKETKK